MLRVDGVCYKARREVETVQGEWLRDSGLYLTLSRSPQLEALDLAGGGLGQLGDELDPARVLVGGELVLDEALELVLEGRRRGVAVLEHDEGLGLAA